MKRAGLWQWLLPLAVIAMGHGAAQAQSDMRVHLEEVDAQASVIPTMARLRVFVSPVTMFGNPVAVFGKTPWSIRLDGATIDAPYISGTAAGLDDIELALVLVVQTTDRMAPYLPEAQATLDSFVGGLPERTKVGVIGYNTDVRDDGVLEDISTAKQNIVGLIAGVKTKKDPPPTLVDALDQAIDVLSAAKPRSNAALLRRIIVVVSDGRDPGWSRQRITDVGDLAVNKSIRIYSMAFSPKNQREPMLALAELSKQTAASFRLVETETGGFAPPFDSLLTELQAQHVLTYFIPASRVDGAVVYVTYRGTRSNGVRAHLNCGAEAKTCGSGQWCGAGVCAGRGRAGGRGWLFWLLVTGGGVLGLLLILAIVGALMGGDE